MRQHHKALIRLLMHFVTAHRRFYWEGGGDEVLVLQQLFHLQPHFLPAIGIVFRL